MAVEQHSQTFFNYCSDFKFDWLEPDGCVVTWCLWSVTWVVSSRDVVGRSAGRPISVSDGWNETPSFKPDPDWKCNCCSPPTAPTCGESGVPTWLPTRPSMPPPFTLPPTPPPTPLRPLGPGWFWLLLGCIEFWSRLSRSYEDYWISISDFCIHKKSKNYLFFFDTSILKPYFDLSVG